MRRGLGFDKGFNERAEIRVAHRVAQNGIIIGQEFGEPQAIGLRIDRETLVGALLPRRQDRSWRFRYTAQNGILNGGLKLGEPHARASAGDVCAVAIALA